jgi:2-phosphosulfolactate phosphatase
LVIVILLVIVVWSFRLDDPRMHLDLVYHPRELTDRDLSNVCCVVLDVLRATTTMSNAIANGAAAIRVFAELEDAVSAHSAFPHAKLLAGERGCLPPAGFDLGNSPGAFTREVVEGRTIFMSTTNGTRAIHACRSARRTLVGALINASATAAALQKIGLDVVFVCAGVDGAPGGEDVDGAATIADLVQRRESSSILSENLSREVESASWLRPSVNRLTRLLDAPGGVNLRRVGLDRDIEFASRIDCVDCACTVVYRGTDAIVGRLE